MIGNEVGAGGAQITVELAEAVLAVALDRLPALPGGTDLTAERLLGPEIWEEMGDGDHRLVGKMFANWARKGQVPLLLVSEKREYPCRYRKIE